MTAQAYPLQWPEGWTRTKPHLRDDGAKFKRGDWKSGYTRPTINTTRQELADELARLGARNIVLSTNVELRIDGQPYSNRRAPDDPGIAVYFTLDGESMVMAQDAYDRVPDNIRSLTLAISGMRQMKRHGGGTMLKRAFRGFTALPPPEAPIAMGGPDTPPQPWWIVLGVDQGAPWNDIRTAYRDLVRDTGGATADLNAAYEKAKEARQ